MCVSGVSSCACLLGALCTPDFILDILNLLLGIATLFFCETLLLIEGKSIECQNF